MKLFPFRYINILRELIENNFPFSPEFGRPKASIFCSRGVPGRLDALLAKNLYRGTRAAVRKSEGASLNPESHEGEGRGGGGMVQSNFPVKILSQFQQTTARIAGRRSHYQASKSLHPSEKPSPILPLIYPHSQVKIFRCFLQCQSCMKIV